MHSVGILQDTPILLKKQVAAMARRAFAQVYLVCQLHPFLVWTFMTYSSPSVEMCSAFEKKSEGSTAPGYGGTYSVGTLA